MISNTEIYERLQDLGLSPPMINEANRMYGLALIYNIEIDKSMDEDELQIDSQQVSGCSLHNDQRLVSPKSTFQLNWMDYTQNTKWDVQSGLRYAITQWEGEQNDIVVEFKRMRLSHTPTEDERILDTYFVLEHMIDQICEQRDIFHHDDIDDAELARLSEIFERQYYGYVTDTELVEAMDRLIITSNANNCNQNGDCLQATIRLTAEPDRFDRNDPQNLQDMDDDEYY
ncbi:unnamed protein product [Adineta ricciae]|uniref:Uncharacterized protein n=1 Tax=Adineta ricciae TaxID=249248 RepID=A0A815D4M7_ADIRI|nr:unnamed protein product [Adineta ricciae]CAF1543660.1 unnamed protein product [Adineta ricciae]